MLLESALQHISILNRILLPKLSVSLSLSWNVCLHAHRRQDAVYKPCRAYEEANGFWPRMKTCSHRSRAAPASFETQSGLGREDAHDSDSILP